jgi:glycosyltransferase involved in cell wall biosynthesis
MHDLQTSLVGHDIICFANDWHSDPLSKKHIMMRLARANRVLWVNSIGTRNPQASVRDLRRIADKLGQAFRGCEQVEENLFVYSPIAVPFHGSRMARWMNRQWLSASVRRVAGKLRFRDPITWTFLPSTAGIAGNLGERALIYHCVDEFSEFTGSDKAALLVLERQLMKRANAVIVSSQPLLEAKRPSNPETFLVTHGVDVDHFRQACDAQTEVPEELAALPKPVIGFFGLIADWVDLELVRWLATARPAWSFVLIGKKDTGMEAVKDLANVHWLGQKPYRELPAFCKGFDIAMLPFVVNPLTVAANPLKLREYLAAGLPAVATAIPEAERLGNPLRTASSCEEFLAHLDTLWAAGRCGPTLDIARTMESESWDEKVRQMAGIVSRFILPGAIRDTTKDRCDKYVQEPSRGV